MSFSLQSFLKRAPIESLETYSEAKQLTGSDGVDWGAETREVLASVMELIRGLSQDTRESVLADFEEVNQLCDEFGQRALRSMAGSHQATFDQMDGAEARGLFMLMSEPREFRHALSIAYSERLYNGRTWSRYFVSERGQPNESPGAFRRFEESLRDLFLELDGSGGKMLVESFERPGSAGTLIQYSIFVESTPLTGLEFDDDQPRRKTRRPVIEAVLCYDPAEGSIDVVAKGGAPARKEIGDAFVECFLAPGSELLPVSPREFDLEPLRERQPFATDPEDGIRQVSVAALRLRNLDEKAGRILVEAENGADLHKSDTGLVRRCRSASLITVAHRASEAAHHVPSRPA